MLSSTSRQGNNFLFERLTIQYSTSTPSLTNQPPTIIKKLPKVISQRISDLPCKKKKFINNSNTQNARRNKNRLVRWFYPLHSQNEKTYLAKLFIKLVRKHLPKNKKYHKIFNLNTFKVSYCCTNNVQDIIKQMTFKIKLPTEC